MSLSPRSDGRRLPILAVLVSGGIWGLWFLSYAAELFASPGLYGFGFLLLGTALGWAIVLLSLAAPWRRGPFRELYSTVTVFARLRG